MPHAESEEVCMKQVNKPSFALTQYEQKKFEKVFSNRKTTLLTCAVGLVGSENAISDSVAKPIAY